jgi:hypothetical protein
MDLHEDQGRDTITDYTLGLVVEPYGVEMFFDYTYILDKAMAYLLRL